MDERPELVWVMPGAGIYTGTVIHVTGQVYWYSNVLLACTLVHIFMLQGRYPSMRCVVVIIVKYRGVGGNFGSGN